MVVCPGFPLSTPMDDCNSYFSYVSYWSGWFSLSKLWWCFIW